MRRNPDKKTCLFAYEKRQQTTNTNTGARFDTVPRALPLPLPAEPLKWFQRSVGVKLRHIHSGCDGAHTAPLVASFSPSSIRALATPWTYFLHLSLSSVILFDSPADVLSTSWCCPNLSIQAVRGLPRLRAPGIVSCTISFSRQLPCFLMVWPYASFLALTVSNSSLFAPALLRTHSLLCCWDSLPPSHEMLSHLVETR